MWANVVLDLSWTCSSRDKKNFEKWVEKLREKFPEAKVQKLDTVSIFFLPKIDRIYNAKKDKYLILIG